MIEQLPFGSTGHLSSRVIFGAAALGAMRQDRADDTLAVLEAIKLEMRMTSPYSGVVRSVEVTGNEQVAAGAPLLRLMPEADETLKELAGWIKAL